MDSAGSAHLLTATLQALQAPAGRSTNVRTLINNSAVTLSRLTNPLNVSLLTTQILAAPALWNAPDTLPVAQAVFDIFRLSTLERARESSRALSLTEWIEAVIAGADARIPRWKHALVSAGVLAAFDAADARLPFTTRSNLEAHLLEVVNFHFEFLSAGIESHACVLAISNTFRVLSEDSKYLIDYPALTGALLPAMFLSSDGYQTGDFLRQIDRSLPLGGASGSKLTVIPSFSLSDFLARPFIRNMGVLARLAATSMTSSADVETINGALSVLATYSRSLVSIWRGTKLSTLPDTATLSQDPAQTNPAQLWQVLKSSLFSAVVVLESIVRTLLQSHHLARNNEIHSFASQIICILRDLYFITHRTNPAAFGTYIFVYHACVDIVLSNPSQAESLAGQLAPVQIGALPTHPTDILRDLYFLNTLEYLVPACTPRFCTSIVSPSLTPTRQFRLAIASLVKYTSPPTALSGIQRDLPDVVLEMLCARIETAEAKTPVQAYVPPRVQDLAPDGAAPPAEAEVEPYTERDVCILAMLDALPFMEEAALMRWLDVAARYVGGTARGDSMEVLRGRFWDVISGELDVGRSQLAIPWWSEGGREVVLGIAGY
ncbi:hypothetical protein ABW21_db0202663 [Orbilia brochopaga]|nr:hypothetical protein ABW21_db0202663 [Drechslerella brochopaga]